MRRGVCELCGRVVRSARVGGVRRFCRWCLRRRRHERYLGVMRDPVLHRRRLLRSRAWHRKNALKIRRGYVRYQSFRDAVGRQVRSELLEDLLAHPRKWLRVVRPLRRPLRKTRLK